MIKSIKFGPGLLVTAAFIGPETVITASASGAHYGFALLWALLFSVIATIILQEMAARLGLATGKGLAESMRESVSGALLGKLWVILVVAAIGVGSAAYEVGNIAGAALAATSVTGINSAIWALAIGLSAGILLWSGRYKILEGTLIILVVIMSVVFVVAAVLARPDLAAMVRGISIPSIPTGSSLTIIGLIGTTVVPYNLFLHANAVREKWPDRNKLEANIRQSRWDTGIAVGLGGLITLAIISTSASAFFQSGLEFNAQTIGQQLEPALGPAGNYIFSAGLFAGGLTSAITAPLAASYAVCGAMGWSQQLSGTQARLVWASVLSCGTGFAILGSRPLAAILFAQVANGLLLPIVAVCLLVLMNRRDILGQHCNGPLANLAGGAVVIVATVLGASKLLRVFGWV
jgi:manganese transport protein